MAFERYGLRLDPKPVARGQITAKTKPTPDLLADWEPRDRGEFVKRVGVPVSAVLLALLAIPLSSSNPRVGRSINLVVALLLYMVYANLLSLMQAWVAQERVAFGIGVWAVHAGAALLVALMFWRRLTLGWRWPRLFYRRAPRAAATP